MSEGGAESGKQRLPYQQGRSPRRAQQGQQQQQPTAAGSSAAAHQMAGYIMPPQQQQMPYPPAAASGYNYPPPHGGQIYHPPGVGPQHLQPVQLQPPVPPHYAAAGGAVGGVAAGMAPQQMAMGQSQQSAYASGAGMQAVTQQQQQQHPQPMQHEPYIQPRVGRLPADRPLMKLSVGLIETYKEINQVSFLRDDLELCCLCLSCCRGLLFAAVEFACFVSCPALLYRLAGLAWYPSELFG